MSIPLASTLSEQVDVLPVIEKSYSVGKNPATDPRNFLYVIKISLRPLSPAYFSGEAHPGYIRFRQGKFHLFETPDGFGAEVL